MQESLLDLLRCPVTRNRFTIVKIKMADKILDGKKVMVISEAVLYSGNCWLYPVINGIPRLNVEAIVDYEGFLKIHVPDFIQRKEKILLQYAGLLKMVQQKNKRTKQSFSKEWSVYDKNSDKTWNADSAGIIHRFLKETDETIDSLKNKIIFDAGCGNGTLNCLLAEKGIKSIAMDFSNSIEKPYAANTSSALHFIQGDVQFPPVVFNRFDIVYCSGVLIHTKNTELSFSCLTTLVKPGGKFSVWLYHHRKDLIHNILNNIRKVTSKLPLGFQYYFYKVTVFPISFLIKRLKGNKENTREMMLAILDWFTPEFRWEHTSGEVESWFYKRNFKDVRVTTKDTFGFNIIGTSNECELH